MAETSTKHEDLKTSSLFRGPRTQERWAIGKDSETVLVSVVLW